MFRRKEKTPTTTEKTHKKPHQTYSAFKRYQKKNVKFSLLKVWLWLFAKPGYGLEKQRDQTRARGSPPSLIRDSGLATMPIRDSS